MTDAASFWDKIADKYARDVIKDTVSYEYTLDRTRTYLTPRDHMLEIGCGTGSTAVQLADSVAHITGTDISPAMIEIARERAKAAGADNIRFAVSDAAAAPPGPFDVVTAFNLLHLIEDLDGLLTNVYSRLRPGGRFISKTFCRKPGFHGEYIMMRLAVPVLQKLGKAPFVNVMSVSALERAMKNAGFEISESLAPPTKDARRYIVAQRPE